MEIRKNSSIFANKIVKYMEIELKKTDILHMGDTIFPIEGLTMFKLRSDDTAFWLTEIFIRNILILFGDYEITDIRDYELDDNGYEVTSLIIETNLPWEEIENIKSTL